MCDRFSALVLTGFISLLPVRADPPVGDFSRLVGEWKYVAMTVKGKKTDPKEIKNHRMLIARDGAISIFEGKAQVAAGRITKVDTGRKPMWIDCVLAGRNEFNGRFTPEVAQKGIFEVTRRKLTMCRTRNAKEEARPSAFAAPPDKDLVLEEFERVQ